MVIINNIPLTHGHPVYTNGSALRADLWRGAPNGWYRAREIAESKVYYHITLVNFTLVEEHTVILRSPVSKDELTVATLGKFPNNWRK